MLLALGWSAFRLERLRTLVPFAFVAGLGAGVFAALCDAVGDHDGVTAIDAPVAAWVVLHRTVLEGQAGLLLAKATGPAVLVGLVLIAALLLRRRGLRLESTILTAGTALAYVAGAAAKYAEHRLRPAAPVNLVPEGEPSFPSGHVLVVATVAALALVLAWHRLSRSGRAVGCAAAGVLVMAVCIDRLVVGAHWFTDVVGALALAAVVVSVTAAAFVWLRPAPPAAPRLT